MLLHLLATLAWWGVMVPWMLARSARLMCVKGTSRHALFARICAELRPFVLVAVVLTGAEYLRTGDGPLDHGLTILLVVVWAYDWAVEKDDDDPWRRRGRRLLDRLTSRTPATAGGTA